MLLLVVVLLVLITVPCLPSQVDKSSLFLRPQAQLIGLRLAITDIVTFCSLP